MHSIFRSTSLALAVILGAGFNAFADDKSNVGDKETQANKGKLTEVRRVHSLMGADITNRQDESLGEVKDLALTRDGEIRYAIVGHGGVLGIGESYIAVPWKMMNPDFENKTFRLDISKAELEKAPTFDQDNYQELNNQAWLAKVNQHFNVDKATDKAADATTDQATPADQQDKKKMSDHRLVRASQIIGANVKNAQKEAIADVNDLVLESRDKVCFAIIGEGGFLEIGENAVAVPFKALNLVEMEGNELAVTLNMTAEKLKQAPVLKQENYQDLMDESFVENARRFFNVNERGEVETEAPADNAKPNNNQPRENQQNDQ